MVSIKRTIANMVLGVYSAVAVVGCGNMYNTDVGQDEDAAKPTINIEEVIDAFNDPRNAQVLSQNSDVLLQRIYGVRVEENAPFDQTTYDKMLDDVLRLDPSFQEPYLKEWMTESFEVSIPIFEQDIMTPEMRKKYAGQIVSEGAGKAIDAVKGLGNKVIESETFQKSKEYVEEKAKEFAGYD